jgi:hypothetical protein
VREALADAMTKIADTKARIVDDHIIAVVPVGRAINPITKTNWEGKGVEPHVAVPADEALDKAKALIAARK